VDRGVTREEAQANVVAAQRQGVLPSYRDRMVAGGITGGDILKKMRPVAESVKGAVRSAQDFTNRTNAWAESFRSNLR
jgi:hypothetical protein